VIDVLLRVDRMRRLDEVYCQGVEIPRDMRPTDNDGYGRAEDIHVDHSRVAFPGRRGELDRDLYRASNCNDLLRAAQAHRAGNCCAVHAGEVLLQECLTDVAAVFRTTVDQSRGGDIVTVREYPCGDSCRNLLRIGVCALREMQY
jgi:hypothetical protein